LRQGDVAIIEGGISRIERLRGDPVLPAVDSWDNHTVADCRMECRVRSSGVLRLLFVFIGASAIVAACSDSPTAPSTDSYSQTDLKVGTGTEATPTSTVSVAYTGWFFDATKVDKKGVQFDTSVGRADFIIALGTGAIIEGWEKGLPGMRVGGQRRLVIPPSLAYGPNRFGSIPPNATLVFDVELLDVK
jgi:FKBP-type peptidyl-prolyl cis-trans isomerase FkpA